MMCGVSLALFLGFAWNVATIHAQSLQLRDLSLGSTISIGSFDYVKVGDSKYMQSSEVTCPDGATVGGKYVKCFIDESDFEDVCSGSSISTTMQKFTPAMCAAFPTPEIGAYIKIGIVTDARDGNTYEVRKFADDKCWIVDNMKYADTAVYTADSDTYGALYTWDNALNTCPGSWRLPIGGESGEFKGLYDALGTWSAILDLFKITNYPGYYVNGASWDRDKDVPEAVEASVYLWSSTEYERKNTEAYASRIGRYARYDVWYEFEKTTGNSVRCVIDPSDATPAYSIMQDFTPADCASYKTPDVGSFTMIGLFQDKRDNNYYEVRKFADGNCWMVDNMKYATTASYTTGSATYGALYNWANAQSTCPAEWRLPTGGTNGEFAKLYSANGSTLSTLQSNWKITISPGAYNGSSIMNRDSSANWWASNAASSSNGYYMHLQDGSLATTGSYSKSYGFSVRCVVSEND